MEQDQTVTDTTNQTQCGLSPKSTPAPNRCSLHALKYWVKLIDDKAVLEKKKKTGVHIPGHENIGKTSATLSASVVVTFM